MQTLETWLAALGLEKYAAAFRDQEVGLDQLAALTDGDLKELGLPLGPRKRILEAAATGLGSGKTDLSATPAAERRQLTIMFVDLVGSTSMSGQLDPEELRAVLRDYHETTAAVVARWGGLVAKLMGDGVLAYFGWPQALETSAERAVRAGLEINASVAKLKTPGGAPLAARTGIATGLVVIGDLIGEGAAQEAAVAGETPNLAARLQGAAEPGGLVVSTLTLTLAGNHFDTEAMPPLSLKGFAKTVPAFKVTSAREGVTRFAARAQPQSSPLLGRESELSLLQDRFKRAALGEGQLVLLTGDAGMGKSRLAEAALAAAPEGARMVWQCAPYHTSTPFHPVVASLSSSVLEPLPRPSRQALERLKSQGPLPDGLTPVQARFETLNAIGQAVAASGKNGVPSILLVEDAHWLDPSTLEALTTNLDAWSRGRIFVLVTARPTFQNDFGGHPCVTRLSLGRLSQAGVGALANAIADGVALPHEAIEDIAAKADGVPLYVEETTRALLASGALSKRDDGWDFTRALAAGGVPATLADALMARLDALAGAKEAAQEAAVIGRTFAFDEAAAIASSAPDALRHALERLAQAQIVLATGDGDRPAFQFKHALLRDAAYDSLLKVRRAALHEKFALFLDGRAGAPLELRAWHFEAAGRRVEATGLWRRAGEAAMARPAFHEAIAHFRRALALANGREALQIETRLGLASIAAQGHSHPDTVAVFERASADPHLVEDPALAFVVWYGKWCGHHVRGEAGLARESAQALHRAALAEGSPANIMMGVRALGITALMNGDIATALLKHDQAAALEDVPRDRAQSQIVGQDQSVSFRSYYGLTLWLAGQAQRAWATIEESIQLARQGAHHGSLGYGLTHAILAAIGLGKSKAAHSLTQELLEKASEYRLGMWRDYALRYQALERVMATGDDAPMQEARVALSRRGVGLFAAFLDAATASALISHGNLDRARTWLERASTGLFDGSENWAAPEVLRIQSDLAAATGDDRGALALLDRATTRARESGTAAFVLKCLTTAPDAAPDRRFALKALMERIDPPQDLPGAALAHAILAH